MTSSSVEEFPRFDNSHFESTQSIHHTARDQNTTKKCEENEEDKSGRPDTTKQQSTEENELEIEQEEIVRPDAQVIQSVQPFVADIENGLIAPTTRFARFRSRVDPILMWVPGTTEWQNPRHLIDGRHPDRIFGRRPDHILFPDNFHPPTGQLNRQPLRRFLLSNFLGILALSSVAGVLLLVSRKKH